jgi:hypothetical protein
VGLVMVSERRSIIRGIFFLLFALGILGKILHAEMIIYAIFHLKRTDRRKKKC